MRLESVNPESKLTCIAAGETVLPSMDTTPCKGAIYLLMRNTEISP